MGSSQQWSLSHQKLTCLRQERQLMTQDHAVSLKLAALLRLPALISTLSSAASTQFQHRHSCLLIPSFCTSSSAAPSLRSALKPTQTQHEMQCTSGMYMHSWVELA